MTLSLSLPHLLQSTPDPPRVDAAVIARELRATPRQVCVVLDDDPTGTQSVADLPVLLSWRRDDFAWAFATGAPAVYVMTNSRSLAPDAAARVNREAAAAAMQAAGAQPGITPLFVSRGDSTLRGHFPLEPDTLAAALAAHTGRPVDATVLVPAFPEAGRVTINGVHYAGSDATGYTPVGDTEFARDASFGYRSSHLVDWVAEKLGVTPAAARADGRIAHIDLATLRGKPEAVDRVLRASRGGQTLAVDAVCEDDLRLLARALGRAELAGKCFVYRVGPPFVRARIGHAPREPLSDDEIAAVRSGAGGGAARSTPDAAGGLVVVGSHVDLTTRQLTHLREHRAPAELVLDVPAVLDPDRRDAHLSDLIAAACAQLRRGTVVVSTSRRVVRGSNADAALATARAVSAAVVAVVRGILARITPAFVIAKGGITSSDVASHGLSIRRAHVIGPLLGGTVSLWAAHDGPARGVPYVVFAGNVGDAASLTAVVDRLTGALDTRRAPEH